jgi:plasmid stability protein
MKTKNITVKIDEETYRRAQLRAARDGTSVSAMVRDFLASQEGEETDPEERRIASLEELYRKVDKRAKSSKKGVKPLTRGEIYAERLR